MDNAVPPPDQRIGRKGTSDSTMHDRKTRPGQKKEMAGAYRINHHCLQFHAVLSDRYSPYYLMFGRRPRLPIDLLFPTCRTQMLTCTLDEYIASLYDRLRDSLVIAQDCALQEAQRQKLLYDHKVGAVEL